MPKINRLVTADHKRDRHHNSLQWPFAISLTSLDISF